MGIDDCGARGEREEGHDGGLKVILKVTSREKEASRGAVLTDVTLGLGEWNTVNGNFRC